MNADDGAEAMSAASYTVGYAAIRTFLSAFGQVGAVAAMDAQSGRRRTVRAQVPEALPARST